MSRVIPASGPKHSKLVLCGEAPGKEEELRLKPFVGAAGQLLDRALRAAGINRSECYVTNVVKVRPPNNDFSHFNRDELKYWQTILEKELNEVCPNVVVALGEKALNALTGYSGILKWRGSILHCKFNENIKVVCAEHPAYLLPNRAPNDFHLLVFDLQRALEESKTQDFPTLQKEMIVDPSFVQVMAFLDTASTSDELVLDVETNRESKALLCLGLSYQPSQSLCIPFVTGKNFRWTVQEETSIWIEVQKLLTNPRIGKIGQNIGFDMNILHKYVGDVYPVKMDTMLAHHTLFIEDPHSLAHLTSIYTKHPYYKEDVKTYKNTGNNNIFWEYNCTDCIVTMDVAHSLMEELKAESLEDFFYGYVMPLFRTIWKMERFGIKVDTNVKEVMAQSAKEEISKLEQEINDLVGFDLNVNSPKQMKEFLYDYLKLPVQRNDKTKRVTADEKALIKLSALHPSPVFDRVLALRGKNKELGTYLSAQVDSDGRMRTSYSISGTDTGRLSSRKGVFGSGMDLQNVPESMRRPFVPDEGQVLVEVDLSQAENRVVAYLAGDERQIDIFERGGDFHSIMAEWLGKPRKVAKSIVHGTNYGMKKRLLSEITGLSQSEAEAVRIKYFETCPKVMLWQLSVQSQLRETKTLTTPLGRRRTFFGMFGDDMFRKAYAFVPQSTVADWLNLNLVACHYALDGVADILLQVHDSMLIQCKPEYVEKTIDIVKSFLERPFKINGANCRIPAEAKVGLNWGEMRKEIEDAVSLQRGVVE